MWEEFDEFVRNLFYFTNGKNIVLWGYDSNGLFIQHLFERVNRKIEYIVDDISIHPKVSIMRSAEIEFITPDIYVVIIAGKPDVEKNKFLEEKGFREDISYIYAGKRLYANMGNNDTWENISYYGYLEKKFDVNISEKKTIDKIERPREDCLNYAPGMGYPLVDVLDNFSFTENDAVFDFGCGKGGALLLFKKSGVCKIAGVEYDKQLYDIICDNFKKMNIETENILHGDAALIKNELDNYNYFFMYNPFQDETFRQVINNIEESWKRKKRRIIFIYSGTYCHKEVILHDLFKLSKQIYTDYSVRNVNIYMIDEWSTGD